MKLVAKVAVAAATYWLDRPYDYAIPEELSEKAVPGVRVYVPFSRGNRRSEGIILAVKDQSSYDKPLKAISAVLDENPPLTQEQIKLALFMRERFFCTVYDAIKAILPAGLWFNSDGQRRAKDKMLEMARLVIEPEEAAELAKAKRMRAPIQSEILNMLCSYECLPSAELLRHTGAKRATLMALCKMGVTELCYKECFRRPQQHIGETEALPQLNDEQQKAFEGLNDIAMSGNAAAALLFGVTGSGKTSVYIHLIDRQLKRGLASILLVPEIALTPQMIATFSSYFGDEVAVLHSSLSIGERYDEWKRVRSGKAKVIIGTRSAVFAPVNKLGLIIIDEEQEETYKSENSPRYNARDVAKFRCVASSCLLLLGSATPDIVSMYKAISGTYSRFTLQERYNDMDLPSVEIVDMKSSIRNGSGSNISGRLKEELSKNIERGEQSILFINRRGANKLVSCGECGFTYKCPNCSVSLTYHSSNNRLMCHYCGYSQRIDNSCPDCGGELKHIGAGTQLIETELREMFPDSEILRMDTDTVSAAGSHEALFERFRAEKIPIMVGTQMVTKGLNFENVTLVGVISADQSLYSGSYRASERTFSLLTQVVGRSGRGAKQGRAIIQTFTPGNETILQAARQNYMDFYNSELEIRRLQAMPPFSEMLTITVSGISEQKAFTACRRIKRRLQEEMLEPDCMDILGPAPLPVVKLNNRFRYRVIIYGKRMSGLRAFISRLVIDCCTDKSFSDVSVYADNDPLD